MNLSVIWKVKLNRSEVLWPQFKMIFALNIMNSSNASQSGHLRSRCVHVHLQASFFACAWVFSDGLHTAPCIHDFLTFCEETAV